MSHGDDRRSGLSHRKPQHWRNLRRPLRAQDDTGLAALLQFLLGEYDRRDRAQPATLPSVHWDVLLRLVKRQRRRELQLFLDELLVFASESGLEISLPARAVSPQSTYRPPNLSPQGRYPSDRLRAAVNHPDHDPNCDFDQDEEVGIR